MSIVCGVDFTVASASAGDVAAGLAQRLRTELQLVHVFEVPTAYGDAAHALRTTAHRALEGETQRLRESGASVTGHLLEGKPDEEMARFASERGARAVIVSALGSRSGSEWQLGGSADRIVQLCDAPVLVVRDPEPFLLWLNGSRPLRAVVALDRTSTSKEALHFVELLRSAAPVDVSAVQVYWANDENRRLGYLGVRSWVDANPAVEESLLLDLREALKELSGTGAVEAELVLTLGRASDAIVSHAQKKGADVVFVGSHRRNLIDRLWNGSTSRQVLRHARESVAVVTRSSRDAGRTIPEVESVLVATDFSTTGDAAVRWAYGVVPPGGTVHLIHVSGVPPSAPTLAPRDMFERPVGVTMEEAAALSQKLQERVPGAALERAVTTDARVVWSSNTALAIHRAAERTGAALIVLGTHGRSGLAKAVLGSVASEVMTSASRPVLLVRPPPP